MILHPRIQELKIRSLPVMEASYLNDAEARSADFKLSVSEDNRLVKGYLAVWDVKDDVGTRAIKGCFSKSIQERGPQSNAKAKIIFLWMHDLKQPLGQFTELVEDNYGLRFTAAMDDTQKATEILSQIRSGTINQFSYGFKYVWDKMEFNASANAVDMYECELWEGSAVTIGSNTETYAIRSAKQKEVALENIQNEIEDFIRKEVPRKKQLELRQLISRQISLQTLKPLEERKTSTLDLSLKPGEEKIMEVGGYKLNLNQFSK